MEGPLRRWRRFWGWRVSQEDARIIRAHAQYTAARMFDDPELWEEARRDRDAILSEHSKRMEA